MSPEKVEKIEKLQTPDLWVSLNFSNLEKNYGETFSAKTKNILQKIYDKELNYDTKNTSSAKQILEEFVKFCKDEGISQEAMSSLELESSLTNILPSRTNIGGVQFQGETSERVRLSYLDNLGDIKTFLRQKQDKLDELLKEKLAAAEKRIESKKQVIVAGGDRIESKKQVIVAQAGEEKEIDQVIVAGGDRIESKKQDNKELKEENKQLKQQLFKAREKKLGRALTEKEKEEILKNIHSRQ